MKKPEASLIDCSMGCQQKIATTTKNFVADHSLAFMKE